MKTTHLLIYIIGIFTGPAFGQQPDIVDEIITEVKRSDQTARLNCTVVNKDISSKVLWTHLDSQQQLSSDRKILVDNPANPNSGLLKYEIQVRYADRRQTYMLMINNLRPEDAGDYLCQVQIQALSQAQYPRKKGLLTVQVPPAIRPAETSSFLQVMSGTNVKLTCAASGNPYPNITWVRIDGGLLPTGQTQHRGSVLSIKKVNKHDRGIYKCVADNNIPQPAEATCQLLVFYAPMVKAVQQTVGQAQNRRFNAKLECIVSGHPLPKFKWLRQTGTSGLKSITDSDKYAVSKQYSNMLKDGETWYTLKIKNVQANDYTMYFCEADNDYGTSRASLELFETMECQGPNCPSLGTGKASGVASSLVLLAISLLSAFGALKRIH